MRWHYLGHAMWLLELGMASTRILFDPLLDDVHDAGLSRLVPARVLDREGLAPDFIVVSHRHPDHFDVDSLAWLARQDPESVVLTADALVAEVCRELGFLRAQVLDTWQSVELADGALLTTPSHGTATEWGIAVISAEGVAWNHVDSVLGGPERVGRTLEVLRGAAGQGVDLHLARWCPVLEVAPQLAGAIGFPRGSYAEQLRALARLGAEEPTVVAPAAASVIPNAPYDSLASNAFPVTPERFARDLAALAPSLNRLDLEVGDLITLERGQVEHLQRASPLVQRRGSARLPTFVPFEVPVLWDPEASVKGCEASEIRDWLENRLAPRLAALAEDTVPLALCLQVRGGLQARGNLEPRGSIQADGCQAVDTWTWTLQLRGEGAPSEMAWTLTTISW